MTIAGRAALQIAERRRDCELDPYGGVVGVRYSQRVTAICSTRGHRPKRRARAIKGTNFDAILPWFKIVFGATPVVIAKDGPGDGSRQTGSADPFGGRAHEAHADQTNA